MEQSVAENVPDRTPVPTRNSAFEAVSAPGQTCSAPLLRSPANWFLKQSESSQNTFIRAKHATEPPVGK